MSQDRTEPLNEIEYHAHEAIGSSSLKTILKSLGHFRHEQKQKKEPTKSMKFGTALHLAVLEPKRFLNEVAVMPKFSGTGMHAAKDKWCTENHGKLIITADEKADVLMMLKSISAHGIASSLLVGGVPELSYFWTDPETKIECKARPDYRRSNGTLVDIKSTADASLEDFSRSVLNYGYHISAAHYLNGVSRVLGQTFERMVLVAVESSEPYGVCCYEIDFGTLEKGQELVSRALHKLRHAKETDQFPAYNDTEIVPISIPTYGFSL